MVDLTGITIPEKLNRDDVKRAAAGQWARILQAAGLRPEQCSPKHKGPCPRCNGRDRFSPFNDIAESGGLLCRQCHNGESIPKAGDGFAAVQWLRGCGFPEALEFVAVELGMRPGVRQPSAVASSKQSKPDRIFDSIEAAAVACRVAGGRQPDRVWHYHDADGNAAGAVLRWNFSESQKAIRPLRFRGGGWVIGGMDEPKPLYRLRDLLAADAGEPIFIVEGEKAADAGASLGLLVITSAGGSNQPGKTDWGPVAGRPVVVIPDHDSPGEVYAAAVVKLVTAAGAASVGVLRLPSIWPECPAAGDLADFSEAHDGQSADSLRDVILGARVESIAAEDAESAADEPRFEDAWQAAFHPKPLAECLIEGLLRRGEVGNIIAATKQGKSWFGLQLLMNMASGQEWLGRRLKPGPVLLIDNELQTGTLENRLANMRWALGIESPEQCAPFHYLSLRGDWKSLAEVSTYVERRYKPGELNLILMDAKYRFFGGGLDENSNADQTQFHNLADRLAGIMDCGVLLIHHSPKGDQSGKSVTDMGAGGGAQSRAADCHLTIRPAETPGCGVLQAAVRSFPPFEDVAIQFGFPLWRLAVGVPPVLADPRKPKAVPVDEMRQRILENVGDKWQALNKLAAACKTKADRDPFAAVLGDLQSEGLIEVDEHYRAANGKETTGVRGKMADSEMADSVGGQESQCRLVSSESTTADTLKGVSAVVGFTGDTNGGQQMEGRIE
jgi:hypothetical protein